MFDFEWNTPEARKRHERIRARGKGRYIVTTAVAYGFVALSFDLAASLGIEHHHFDFLFLLRRVIQWGLFGLFLGWWTWRIQYEDRDGAK